jgi:hypothetical protein
MFDFSREVFICKCSTEVDLTRANVPGLRFRSGARSDLSRLDPAYHDTRIIEDMQQRLERGEYWMLGEQGDDIVTYTWLFARGTFRYTYLPGCEFTLGDDTAYGYGAWTPNHLRGHGLRQRAFLEELDILRGWGKKWEASVFIKQQLEGAKRSLGKVGIEIVPLWRVVYGHDRKLVAERLLAGEQSVLPVF